jgi:hypothetical protein
MVQRIDLAALSLIAGVKLTKYRSHRSFASQVWARGIIKKKIPIPTNKLKGQQVRLDYDVALHGMESLPVLDPESRRQNQLGSRKKGSRNDSKCCHQRPI